MPKRILKGKIVTKSEKTLKVSVERKVIDPLYGKISRRRKNYLVHNPDNKYNVNDEISIVECRPISKKKCFEVVTED